MAPLAEDVALFLAGKGLGTVGSSAPATIGPETRDAPDDLIVVREYPGGPPDYSKSGHHTRNPRFQVSCRSRSTRAALLRCEDAFRHLSGFSGLMNGTEYARVDALQDPFPIGRDEAGRERVVCNFQATR